MNAGLLKREAWAPSGGWVRQGQISLAVSRELVIVFIVPMGGTTGTPVCTSCSGPVGMAGIEVYMGYVPSFS
jgi:hypothetical protein